MEDVRHAGHQLRVMREERKLTQTELGVKAGVSTQAVSRLELGNVSKPDMDTLVRIGKVYGMTPNAMAELYGYWMGLDPLNDQRERLRARIDQLPEEAQKSLMDWIEQLIDMTVKKYGV